MSISTRLPAIPASFARALAISTLMGAMLLGTTSLTTPLLAQTAAAPPAVANSAGEMTETIEQRITSLHDKLKITASEEASWASVAQVMRENSATIEKLVAAKRAQSPGKMTALDDLSTYQALAQARVDGLQRLNSAFSTLYNGMPAAQQAVADETFRNFGRGNSVKGG